MVLFTMLTLICTACASNREVLHYNVKEQNILKLKENITQGANINERDRNGFTPLISAAYYDYGPLVKYLCEKAANINAQNNEGWSALLYAVYYGYDDSFKILMEHGADVNLVNNREYNALGYAKHYNREEMYRKLEEAAAKRPFEQTHLR
jgi:ankyrin repeat protein